MTDIAASDVTVTINKEWNLGGLTARKVTIAVGDGSLTVPSGGIPLAKIKLGYLGEILLAVPVDSSASGFKCEYDISAEKILQMYYDYDDTGDDEAMVTDSVAVKASTTIWFFLGW